MKIAISMKGTEKNNLMDMRFGRCDHFTIYNTEKDTIDIIDNKGKSSSGGAGIVAAQQLIDENVDVIITGNLGPNAFKIIEKSNIKVYKCDDISLSIESIIKKYKLHELTEIETAGPGHLGMGR